MKSTERTVFEIILAIAVALSIALLPGLADARGGGPNGPPAFSDFDLDGDGYLSEEELAQGRAKRMAEMAAEGRQMKGAASHPSFADLDSDGDGRLSEEEFRAGRQAHRQAMHGSHQGKGHGKGMKMPTFQDLDLDANGCIDAAEFADHQQKMHGRRAE